MSPRYKAMAIAALERAWQAAQSKPRPVDRIKVIKGRKKHSENRERSRLDVAKAARAKRNANAAARARSDRLAETRAYWSGKTDQHP